MGLHLLGHYIGTQITWMQLWMRGCFTLRACTKSLVLVHLEGNNGLYMTSNS